MPKVQDSPLRTKMRMVLKEITRCVKASRLNEFNPQLLKHYGIRLEPMVLDEKSPLKPRFFAPFPFHALLEIDEHSPMGPYNGIDDDPPKGDFFDCPKTPYQRADWVEAHLSSYIAGCVALIRGEEIAWTDKSVGDYPFKGLSRYCEQPSYVCASITDLNGTSHPHVKAIMLNNMVASDSTVLFGELLPALRIMLLQVRRDRFLHHIITPVMIISLMGMKARVIEVYQENGTLVVRPTEMIDFTHANDDGFKQLTQWYLGKAIGDTVETA
ncbi:hypothetical protein BJX63DRAFT_396154 [Aspergillus granulosus]|uniref:Uncharacterized protein n=1 Tax=Aspergillus granulosus TaxID=176169 RepID=A0ABR4HBB8_9EURO